jgi:NADH-quinone oxidoreductase subunit L
MVTAGAYLLMRLFPIIALSSVALITIATVAAFTGLFAALAALGQRDIKRILAYSTISQVSYMFLGVGAGDVAGGMYHLLSHASFKALLFLAAGCVIQALHEEHDIFKMGSLRQRLPVVFWLYLAGVLSLGAIPPFGGFFSKDRILLSTFSHPEPIYKVLAIVAEIGALITVLYTFRMFFVAFLERPSTLKDLAEKDLKIPRFMVWINSPLAILAIFASILNFPEAFGGTAWLAHYLAAVPGGVPPFSASAALEKSMEVGSGLLNLIILGTAYLLYRPERRFLGWSTPLVLRQSLEELLSSGFYLDRLYQMALVRPYREMARILWLTVDEGAIDDRLDGTGMAFRFFSSGLQPWTTGRLSTYLKMLLLGFTAIVSALALGWYYLR